MLHQFALFGLLFLIVFFVFLTLMALRIDQTELEKNRIRTKSFLDALKGRAEVHDDWIPDARVKGGMIYNKGQSRLEISGQISRDAAQNMFKG